MENLNVIYPLLGGSLIGLAVTIMLLFNGRVTGISGIISSSLAKPSKSDFWRIAFLLGLIFGGAFVYFLQPTLFVNISNRSPLTVAIAGLLVGYGTVMGSGCTSGHGICGLSRLSMRSMVATLTFMLFGFLSVQIFQFLTGGQ